MMSVFGLFEAKNRFSELVGRAQSGEEVIVTKHGRPAARIVAYENREDVEYRERLHQDSILRIRALRAQITTPLPIEDILSAKHEGHRY